MKYLNKNFYVEKVKVENLIKKFKTPFYCYSYEKLKSKPFYDSALLAYQLYLNEKLHKKISKFAKSVIKIIIIKNNNIKIYLAIFSISELINQ